MNFLGLEIKKRKKPKKKRDNKVKRKKKLFDLSMVILLCISFFMIAVISMAFYMMWSFQDLSSLSEIIIGVYALETAIVGLIIWKLKNTTLVEIIKENPQLTDEVKEEIEEELLENIDKDFN